MSTPLAASAHGVSGESGTDTCTDVAGVDLFAAPPEGQLATIATAVVPAPKVEANPLHYGGPVQAVQEKVFSPILTAFCMPDPRRLDVPVSVVAFYYPDRMTSWDLQRAAGFLGNFWCMGKDAINLDGNYFTNAEAAFQATKFWNKVDLFRDLNGNKAFQLKCSLQEQEDMTYNGRGSNWKAMLDVLAAKYQPNSACAEGLLDIGDAFLLEHNER
jgi:hypothetical protein